MSQEKNQKLPDNLFRFRSEVEIDLVMGKAREESGILSAEEIAVALGACIASKVNRKTLPAGAMSGMRPLVQFPTRVKKK